MSRPWDSIPQVPLPAAGGLSGMEWGGPRAHAVTLVQGSCTSWQWHWNVTQVETVEALGQSRCTVTGSHGC